MQKQFWETLTIAFSLLLTSGILNAANPPIKWDSQSLIVDGKRIVPVMGEVHFSRIPSDEWETEIRKMKEGGITVIATYIFWNHIEEEEGIFNWKGQRNLKKFVEICKKENLLVALRLGPFCHGEVRNGGIPDWIFSKGCKIRDENPVFLHYVELLYSQIYTQIEGLQWKDGGPIIAAQFDNEYGGHGSYLMALKKIAINTGFDLPFYTRTGWPELKSPIPYGEMIPLYGDYADGFWDRSIEETAGEYYKAFNFKEPRNSTTIASEQLGKQNEQLGNESKAYPYFTCELGGGMMTSYHRRPYLYPEDAYSMAIVKLGSGSNLLGYYMYHGGTNPDGKLSYLNENQRTVSTNSNDMPVKTYDFQAPLGEFGQKNPHYYLLRKLHLFMHDFGDQLALMDAHFPNPRDIEKGDDSFLRWSYRSNENSGFVFINNYERLQNLSAKKNISFDVCGIKFPSRPIDVPAGTMCIFPVNVDGIKYATAQMIAKRDGKIYLEQIPGIPTEIAFEKKVLKNVKARGLQKPVVDNIYLIDSETAGKLFLEEEECPSKTTAATFVKTKQTKSFRKITIGVKGVAEEPTDDDFNNAAVYSIGIPEDKQNTVLDIEYRGDCARLYADGNLIDDNFYNGRNFQYALWRLPESCQKLELRILPLQSNMPIYFPREAKTDKTGEELINVSTIKTESPCK